MRKKKSVFLTILEKETNSAHSYILSEYCNSSKFHQKTHSCILTAFDSSPFLSAQSHPLHLSHFKDLSFSKVTLVKKAGYIEVKIAC